jgi:membrane protein YqaA with SNARE-associated domain
MHNLISADVSPLGIYAVTVVVSVTGGLLPFSPLEPVLLGIAAVARPSMLLPVVALATVTQMASKTALYAASRKANHALSPRKRAFLDRLRIRLAGRRWLQVLMVLVSALFGLPPFYMMTVACGALGLPLSDYLVAGSIGRATRFTVLMMLPQLFAAAHR